MMRLKNLTFIFSLLLACTTAWAGPKVTFTTNLGAIVLELDPEQAPATVENFLQYAGDSFFDGTIFHRVIPGFVIQGGGFTTNFERKPTRAPIQNEAANGLKNARGTISMARTGNPHSATSQFFINLVDNTMLDHTQAQGRGWGYAVFGKVVAGMDIVDQIAQIQTGPGGPFPRDVPQTAVVIEATTIESNTPNTDD